MAAQPKQRTVAGALADALEPFKPAGRLVVAGRTDAGVHATAQVAHVDLDAEALERLASGLEPGADVPALVRALNGRLDPAVRVWRCRVMAERFDARRDAFARRYRYLLRSGAANPLERGFCWQIEEPLDLAAMRLAAPVLLGEHDFAAFCRAPADRPDASLVRRVIEVEVLSGARGAFAIEIEANAFCHQMVRSIVGMLVAIGTGRLEPETLAAQLRSRSRTGAPTLAPAHGLSLIAVRYPDAAGGTWALEAGEDEEPGPSSGPFATRSVLL